MNEHEATVNGIWMNYFNEYLFEKGIITEAERNKMKNMIAQRSQGSNKKAHFIMMEWNDF